MQHKSGRTAEEYDDLDKWIEIELRQTEAKQYEVSHTAQDTKLKTYIVTLKQRAHKIGGGKLY